MSSLYAMQRANGDWLGFDDRGRLRMPVFRSNRIAKYARSINPEMFLFKPAVFDERALKALASEENGLFFLLVDDPSIGLGRGRPLDHAQLELLMHKNSGKT